MINYDFRNCFQQNIITFNLLIQVRSTCWFDSVETVILVWVDGFDLGPLSYEFAIKTAWTVPFIDIPKQCMLHVFYIGELTSLKHDFLENLRIKFQRTESQRRLLIICKEIAIFKEIYYDNL